MRGTSNINKTSTTSSWILKGPLTGSGTQRYVQLYNTNANLINIMQQLYDRTSNAVYHDDRLGDWFRTTVGVRQGCLLSPTLFFQHLLIRKKSWMMHWKTPLEQSVGESGYHKRFADDIDRLAGDEQELAKLVEQWTQPQLLKVWRSVPRKRSWWPTPVSYTHLTLPTICSV